MSSSEERAVGSAARTALDRDRGAAAVGLRIGTWHGPDSIALSDGRIANVVHSDSVLEIRERLIGATETNRVVILTSLTEEDLGDDVVYRLAGRRIRAVGIWDPLLEAFAARRIDPRLRQRRTLAEILISLMPKAGYAKAPNGTLTMDHAWAELVGRLFEGRPRNAAQLIVSASQPASASRLKMLSNDLVEPLIEKLGAEFGVAAGPIVRAVHSGHSSILVPLGLVGEIVFPPGGGGSSALAEARGALRTQWGGPVEPHEGRAVAQAALVAFEEADGEQRSSWINSAHELIEALALKGEIGRSSVLPGGFEERVRVAVDAIATAEGPSDVNKARQALHAAGSHREGSVQRSRIERLRMALRLRLFLNEQDAPAASFEDAASQHAVEGGWVDFARETLRSGSGEVALEQLLRDVDARQRERSTRFAQLLADATAAGSSTGVIGVEDAIASRIAPLGRDHPLALIVLDGLSEGAFRPLGHALAAAGWTEVGPNGEPRPPMVATLPSVTTFSRTSLLSGTLMSGHQKEEREGFDRALVELGEARLFHKADLAANFAEVEAEIAGGRQVVGIVINAIDDMLDKGDQVKVVWSVEAIDPLRAVLSACEAAGRAVVIAGDHGHVFEHGSELQSHSGAGSRWRPADDDELASEEVLVEGKRVLAPGGRAILAATENVRYAKKAAGYHGGATPQETVAPLAVLTPRGVDIPGWSPCSRAEPGWWLLEDERPVAEREPERKGNTPAEESERPRLFGDPQPVQSSMPDWVGALLSTDQFTALHDKAVRPPSRDRIAEFLAALDARDFRVSEAAVAREMRISSGRVRGLVASLRSLLNLEGYQVLKHDLSSGDIELDRDLLGKQFSL